MNLCLILDTNPSTHDAENIWRTACQESGDSLEILQPEKMESRVLIEQLHLNTFPALVLNDRVLAVGIPTPEDAKRLLTQLKEPDAN